MGIQLVIFDFDGTLADTHRTIIATVQQTLKELGLPIATEESITETIGLPLRDCYRHYLPNLDDAGLDACEATHHRLFDINRKMKIAAEHTLVVGDMGVDILMGARAGCKAVGVTYGNGRRDELNKAYANFIIEDMKELKRNIINS